MSKSRSPGVEKGLFLIGTIFFWTSLYIYSPILSPYANFLSRSSVLVGLVVASYGFTQLLFRFPVGIWSDKIGKRKPFVLSGFALVFISCFGLALSPNAWTLLAFRAVAGIAASMWVAFTVLYSSYFRDDQSARAMSLITFCVGCGQAIGAVGGRLADAYGWTAPFYAGAGLSVIGLAFMLAVPEKANKANKDRSPASFHSLLLIASQKRLLLISIIAAFSQFAMFSTTFGFLPLYAETLSASKSQLGLLAFIITSLQTLAMLITGTLVAPRIGYKATVSIAYFGVTLTTFATPFIQDLGLLFLVQGAGALVRGLAYPVLMGLAIQGVPREEKAAAMGFFQAVYAIGMFSGPAASGFIGDAVGLQGVFFCSAAVYLIAAGLSIFMLPTRIKHEA